MQAEHLRYMSCTCYKVKVLCSDFGSNVVILCFDFGSSVVILITFDSKDYDEALLVQLKLLHLSYLKNYERIPQK